MDRLKAFWGRLGKPEQIAIAVGIPLVALAAIISSRRAKPTVDEGDPEKLAPTGIPQQFGPSGFDIQRQIDEAVKALKKGADDVTTKADDVKAVTNPNLAGLAHADLIARGDAAYAADPGSVGPYLAEIRRRFAEQGSGPDGVISVNGSYWLRADGSRRAIWYAAAPSVLQLLPPGTWQGT